MADGQMIPEQATEGLPEGVYWYKLKVLPGDPGEYCKCGHKAVYVTVRSPEGHDKKYKHKMMLIAGTPDEIAAEWPSTLKPELWDGRLPSGPGLSQADPQKAWGKYKVEAKVQMMQKDETGYSPIHLLPPLITKEREG